MDRRAWQATVHGVAKSWTRLSDYAQHSQMRGKLSSDCKFTSKIHVQTQLPMEEKESWKTRDRKW